MLCHSDPLKNPMFLVTAKIMGRSLPGAAGFGRQTSHWPVTAPGQPALVSTVFCQKPILRYSEILIFWDILRYSETLGNWRSQNKAWVGEPMNGRYPPITGRHDNMDKMLWFPGEEKQLHSKPKRSPEGKDSQVGEPFPNDECFGKPGLVLDLLILGLHWGRLLLIATCSMIATTIVSIIYYYWYLLLLLLLNSYFFLFIVIYFIIIYLLLSQLLYHYC